MKCETPTCKSPRREGDRYCRRCGLKVIDELKRAGYLTPLPSPAQPVDPEVLDLQQYNAFVKDRAKGGRNV